MKERMSQNYFGEIIGMYMPFDAKDGMKNRGYCFLEYAKKEAVNKALGDRRFRVQPWNMAVPKTCRLFVGNLDNEMIEKKILGYFSVFGVVVD